MEPNYLNTPITQAEEKMEVLENNIETLNDNCNVKGEYIFNKQFFVDRSLHEDENGYYDENLFFHTPEGSFWNDEQDYFNRFGYDKYGGFYDKEGIYIPGEGWNHEFQCYKEDIDQELLQQQLEQIEEIFEDRINLINSPCNISKNSENFKENQDDFEEEDFLKVKEIMEEESNERDFKEAWYDSNFNQTPDKMQLVSNELQSTNGKNKHVEEALKTQHKNKLSSEVKNDYSDLKKIGISNNKLIYSEIKSTETKNQEGSLKRNTEIDLVDGLHNENSVQTSAFTPSLNE